MMCRLGIAVLLVALGGVSLTQGADTQQTPPNELLQYVRNSRQHGVKDAQIRQEAVRAGWTGAQVDQTIAFVKDGKTVAAAPESSGADRDADSAPPAAAQAASVTIPQVAKETPAAAAKNRGVPDDYVIGAGDVLQISVWKEPDASVPSVVVRPDGKIAMPLIKEVEVLGLTPIQAENLITSKLGQYINGVDVTVVVAAINSKKVYILGAVKKEGPIPYTYRMSVMQAISEAGGLTDYAKRKKIYVLRTEGGKDYRMPFNYQDVIKGEKMEQNVQLLPGDTVVVPN